MCCKNPVDITLVSLLNNQGHQFIVILLVYTYIAVLYIYLLITQSCFINAGTSSIWVILPVPACNSFWHIVNAQEIFLDWNYIDRHKHLYRSNSSLLHIQAYLPRLIGPLFKKFFNFIFLITPHSMWILSFLTRDGTHLPYIGSAES